ncbi:helix-turn-helix domain-containing protein [Caballeronia sp. dw_19]|uniref:helix-turn-helix domain-containing protein n=1 Tax=Caballeronia sp. dw_19 TaxID=2719791 RepID=UPI001BCE7A23|nr:helix-turn-helix domain-containing protein [Caballeronia sp. dw_19]
MKTFTEVAWTKALKPSPKLLLLILARRSEDTNGVCSVSAPDLAAELGTTLMTVYAGVATLEEKNLVTVHRSEHAAPNSYCLRLETWA